MRVKKISSEQFLLDVINKMFEIAGSNLHWLCFEKLKLWTHEPENRDWFRMYTLTLEQYLEFRDYYLTHFYDLRSKRISHSIAESDFSSFMFQYGFPYVDFSIEDVPRYEWKKTN